MTALAAGIALVPLMIGADEPGKEILEPGRRDDLRRAGGQHHAAGCVSHPVLFLLLGKKPLERLLVAKDEQREVACLLRNGRH